MTYNKVHPLNLPEILTDIFYHLDTDGALYPSLFVNRMWYMCSIPILWKEACFYGSNKKRCRSWERFTKSINTQSPFYASRLGCLSIQKCKVTNDALYQIGKLCPNLHRLIISYCNGFSSKIIGKIV